MLIRIKGLNWSSELWALLSGVLLFLSFPKFGTGIVAWFALVPLLRALMGSTVTKAFKLGFLSGLAAHLGILYWISYVVVKYGNLSPIMGAIALFLLVSYMSLYTAIFSVGVSFAQSTKVPIFLAVPVLWTSLEYVKTYAFTGFPWALLGYSQFQWPVLIQLSDVTGVYGLSFVIALVNALLYEIIFLPHRKFLKAAGIFLSVGLVILYGLWRIGETEEKIKSFETKEVGIVQGNVDQSVKWNPAYQDATMASYLSLTEQVVTKNTYLVVWPETATPFFYQDPSPYREQITDLVMKKKVWLLFGSPRYQRDREERVTIFNSVYLLTPQGEVKGKYDKVHLVPYGEYVPLRKIFPFINKLVHGIGDFGTGPGYVPLEMDGEKVGVLICYEAIFPEAARAYARSKAGLLVNVTNDAWFGHSSAPYQHLSMSVLRAVEHKLYLIRAANTGVSAFIDPIGRIKEKTRLFTPATLYGPVKFLSGQTFYSQYGDVFSYLCVAMALFGIFISGRRKGR